MATAITSIDTTILHTIQDFFGSGAMDFIMPQITALGNKGFIWIAIALVLICTKKYSKCGIIMLVALAAGVLIGNMTLKPLLERPRPCWVEPHMLRLISNPTGFSFPSGHTLSSFIGATVILLHNRKWGYMAIVLAALIAFSRLYLFVHYPTDILGGIVLGVTIAVGITFAARSIAAKFGGEEQETLRNI